MAALLFLLVWVIINQFIATQTPCLSPLLAILLELRIMEQLLSLKHWEEVIG